MRHVCLIRHLFVRKIRDGISIMKIAVGKNDAKPPKTILCGFIFVGEFVDYKLSEGFLRPRGFGYGIFDILMEIPVSIPRIPDAIAKGDPSTLYLDDKNSRLRRKNNKIRLALCLAYMPSYVDGMQNNPIFRPFGIADQIEKTAFCGAFLCRKKFVWESFEPYDFPP